MRYKIEIDIEEADNLAIEVLKGWYEDALLNEDIGTVLKSLDSVIQYGTTKEDYESWKSSIL